MNYFTPEFYNRGNSPRVGEQDDLEEEWDRRIERYNRRWQKIKGRMPETVRRFEQGHVCLHDAKVLSLGREEDRLLWFLETEAPARKPVVLTFCLLEEPAVQTDTFTYGRQSGAVYWLYEEWNVDRQQRPTLEVLLSNGWVVRLVFRDFQYVVAEPALLHLNGQAQATTPLTAARPA